MDVNKLQSNFTPLGIWAFSIGTSIGWGSFIVTCNTYLQKSGLLGTFFGLLIGMAVILVVTWNLQYMIRKSPDAGGIYTFEKNVSGKDLGFLAAWFVLLTYLAVLWANITSVPLFTRFFLGDAFHFGFHYHVFGYEVWFGEALLSILATLLIGLLCSQSSRLPNRIMAIAALVFVAGFTVCAVLGIVLHENDFSYSPMYVDGSNAFAQIVRIAAISPWAFIGFENVSHFSEEYTFPVKKIRGILICSVLLTTVLYLLVSVLSVSAYPEEYESWMAYIRDMGNLSGIKAVPAFYAANHYLGRTGVTILMLALFGVILTSLIGNMLALSRLLYATGRDGEAPEALKKLNGHGTPCNAVYAIVAVSVFIPFLGRTAIGWIVDVTTLGATLIYGMISYAVFVHARSEKRRLEQCTGIFGLVLMGCFMLLLLIPGLLPFHAMATESYALFIAWSLLGLAYFRHLLSKKEDSHQEYEKYVIVWVIFLVLILFASMMWVSRATEQAASNAVKRIYEYHQAHPEHDSENAQDRLMFLNEQAKQVGRTNTLYSAVTLGLFVVYLIIMLHHYRHTKKLGRRLSDAEERARTAQKIAKLKETLSALLNNMPALSFSKDAETGVYLACNQSFAKFANKENPEGVIGLIDTEIFDPVTAEHFNEDDRMVLSMDKPYSFFEDVLDAEGNRKQFQTTKLKFTDDDGRLCILGMCLDLTDMLRVQQENETTKEAYHKVLNTSLVYTRIAQTLASGYEDLYYVNLDTEEFIEYVTKDSSGTLHEARRGEHFFDECRREIGHFVYIEDQAEVLKALERQTLLEALDRERAFIMTYRILSEHGPRYVTIKVSRMEDDERFIVIGVTDVNEQVKQRRAAERALEEHTAYARLNSLTGDFLSVYIVDPDTEHYREYSASKSFDSFALPKEGENFFSRTIELGRELIYPEDFPRFVSLYKRENVFSEIERNGIFSMTYRLIVEGKPIYVQLKAAMVNEKEGCRLVVGINDIDAHVRQEEEYEKRLAQAQSQAKFDALTGVNNRHSYLDAEEQLDRQIATHSQPEFAIVIMDVNDLKKVNDSQGHKAGDQYLRDACQIICSYFSSSTVFRVGGDEFAVIVQGNDYASIEELVEKMNERNIEASRTGGIVIACGMSKFENDLCVAPVFERADQRMYENKNMLKTINK